MYFFHGVRFVVYKLPTFDEDLTSTRLDMAPRSGTSRSPIVVSSDSDDADVSKVSTALFISFCINSDVLSRSIET